jgi:predicted DNA-binding transcriptional regulator AlpA
MRTVSLYLDIYDLAAMLGVSLATIHRRLRTCPWNLPPPVYLGRNFPLRWRRADVAFWKQEISESEN